MVLNNILEVLVLLLLFNKLILLVILNLFISKQIQTLCGFYVDLSPESKLIQDYSNMLHGQKLVGTESYSGIVVILLSFLSMLHTVTCCMVTLFLQHTTV